MPELAPIAWLGLGFGAICAGFSKTGIGGVGSIAVALYAQILPTKASTGTLLLLLLLGDCVAVTIYRHDVAWRDLARLIGPVVVGVITGTVFLKFVSDQVLKITMGIVLLFLVALHVVREAWAKRQAKRKSADDETNQAALGPVGSSSVGSGSLAKRMGRSFGYGSLAGFTTMVANSGGVAMTLYLLTARFSMLRFLGTGAWFFFAVNCFKVPFSLGLGIMTVQSLKILAVMAPLVLLGTWLGRKLIARINQAKFNAAALAFTAVAAAFLLV